ncbi:hypothetical protein C8Q80DRAFT_737925 [Daedaleopsis nitida]|nr:hypothetical protein C8Q80DRAFT_737925 [Daedaleopsis nitida]
MYDYPSPASSSTPPSPRPTRKQHHRRSQSPLPHLATLLPTTHHHQYSPSTRAADISRLLDPAYASSSSSSSMSATPSPYQTRAYVDHNGDLHDPDYRDFPVLRPSSRSHQPSKRRTSASSAVRSRSQDRYAMQPPRPSWERDWGTELGDSDEEDQFEEAESQSHFSPFASHHGSPRKSTAALPRTNYYYYADAAHTSSPLSSYEDESPNALQLHESPFGEDETDEVIEESRKTASLIRKVSKPKKSVSVDLEELEKDCEEPCPMLRSLDDDEQLEERGTTPTCTHVLRQQWHAMTLRVRFGVFHAKRRLLTRRQRT